MPKEEIDTEPETEEVPGQEEEPPKKKRKSPVTLTTRQKLEMFERWDTGNYSLMDMARWYGCSDNYIHQLIKRREEVGKDEIDRELEDALALKHLENSMAIGALKIGKILTAIKPSVGNAKVIKDFMKVLLDVRKQLTHIPKDLAEGPAPISFSNAMKLAKLIPEEHRAEYFEIMKGLTQTSDKPKAEEKE